MSKASDATQENEAFFDTFCNLLQLNHRKDPSHTPRYTLNRLFRKDLGDPHFKRTDLPMLTPQNVSVRLGRRSKVDLCKLDQASAIGSQKGQTCLSLLSTFVATTALLMATAAVAFGELIMKPTITMRGC
jgi:hypothetical protein